MSVVSQEVIERPLEKQMASVKTYWPGVLTSELQKKILTLTNTILENEDTIGFARPLNDEDGRKEMEKLATAVESGEKKLLLVEHKATGDVIGHLVMSQSELPNCRHIAEISRTMVHPDHRGFSVILLGMYEVLSKCREIDVEVLQLDVRANTRIHRLWERMGFKSIGIMEDYARVNGVSYAGCFMYQPVKLLRDRFLKIS